MNNNFLDIRFEEVQESFGMGGPYLGDCYLNNRKLRHSYLADNCVFSTDGNYLLLSQYTAPEARRFWGLFSFIPNVREFRIVVIDLSGNKYFIGESIYTALMLDKMDKQEISFYKAFHKESSEYKDLVHFESNNFYEITPGSLFES